MALTRLFRPCFTALFTTLLNSKVISAVYNQECTLVHSTLKVFSVTTLVSIIICTADRYASLNKTLQALKNITYPSTEIIIIDASSELNELEKCAVMSNLMNFSIKIIPLNHKNISVARNLGIRASSGTIIAFLDDDAIPPVGWIDKLLLTYSTTGDKCAGVGGAVRDMTKQGHPLQFKHGISSLLSETVPIRSSEASNYNRSQGFWYNGLMGTNSSYRKDLLEKINGYDEFFEYFLDETDVCLRLIQAGYEIHYSDVVVDHYPQPSHNRKDQKHLTCWYSLAKNTTYFALKHGFKRVSFPILVTRLTLLLIRRCLLRILRLKFTHNLSNSILLNYIKQSIEGIRIGWEAGLALHKVDRTRET